MTLNVLHARDLELQTRIACDDDRIRSAIARYNRADPENPQEDALSAGMCHLFSAIMPVCSSSPFNGFRHPACINMLRMAAGVCLTSA